MKLYANGRSVLHQGDGHTQTAIAPDVCKTPSPAGPLPVPYVNRASDGDLTQGSKSVRVYGHPVALKDSSLSTSTGDEPGTAGGGLISSKIQGRLVFLTASLDVVVEGQGVVRFLDTFLANANTPNTTGLVYGTPLPATLAGGKSPLCDACGRPFSDHAPGLESTADLQKELRLLVRGHTNTFKQLVADRKGNGFMLGMLKCKTRDGATLYISAISGMIKRQIAVPPHFPSGPGLQGDKFNKALKLQLDRLSQRRSNKVDFDSLKGSSPTANEPGACAAPRLLLYAMSRGWEPLSMLEQWYGPPTEIREPGQYYGPCETCRKLLPVLLCEARQRAKNEPLEQERDLS